MVDIQTISIAIASTSVVAGVIYYVFQVRHQTKTRQTDLIMRLYATFSSTEFQDAWGKVRTINPDLAGTRDLDDLDKQIGLRAGNQVCLFFEGVGILLQRKLVDTTMVEDLFGGAVERAWEKIGKTIIRARQQLNDPSIYYYFEYLYNQMKKNSAKTD